MLTVSYASRFLKDLKLCQKRGLDMRKLLLVLNDLENEIPLSAKYKAHPLKGNYTGHLECHIEPDWLLIYKILEDEKELYLTRTGTHADLF